MAAAYKAEHLKRKITFGTGSHEKRKRQYFNRGNVSEKRIP